MNEATKAWKRRRHDPRYADWIAGRAVDIGCGNDPISSDMYPGIKSIRHYDKILGDKDAEKVPELERAAFDCVHSSHCLEHLKKPFVALLHWCDLLVPGGILIVTVPDEDLYEHGIWPSRFNGDHKTSWTVFKLSSSMPASVNVLDVLSKLAAERSVALLSIARIEEFYDWGSSKDQTLGDAECAIEFALRRL